MWTWICLDDDRLRLVNLRPDKRAAMIKAVTGKAIKLLKELNQLSPLKWRELAPQMSTCPIADGRSRRAVRKREGNVEKDEEIDGSIVVSTKIRPARGTAEAMEHECPGLRCVAGDRGAPPVDSSARLQTGRRRASDNVSRADRSRRARAAGPPSSVFGSVTLTDKKKCGKS